MTARVADARPLRVGIVGAGQMARNHAAVIGRGASARLVGVYDRRSDRAEAVAAATDARTFDSLDALVAGAQPDVIHVCTPPDAHVEAAYAALDAGVHVYIEKPFARTTAEARELLDLAAARHRLVCAGHQLLFDAAFVALGDAGPDFGDVVRIDSDFAFRPPAAALRSVATLARQTIDILPHPLYTLVALMERFGPPGAEPQLAWADGSPSGVHASLRMGNVLGRLAVSLDARPVASTLSVVGTNGALTADFVRSIVFGSQNAGTEALEKIANPMLEGLQLVSRTAGSLSRRLRTGVSYPGLAELIHAFHRAIAAGAPSPISPAHLMRVTALFEELSRHVQPERRRAVGLDREAVPSGSHAPLVVVTGAGGFLGREIARALEHVRGIGRGEPPDGFNIDDWVTSDLSEAIRPSVLAGADAVVHAAAATSGGFAEHQRDTIDATRHLLDAMDSARVDRLVLVSSLSVVRPPTRWLERQNESTPRDDDPRRLGPYVWGKSQQEELVLREAATRGIATRIIRPGALIDWSHPEIPGLMGRRLFGRWHLGLGRPSLPIALCDVRMCADAIAWCATHFDDAPPIVNLFDPSLPTRASVIARMRTDGWRGRMLWMPISLLSLGIAAARAAVAAANGRRAERCDAWSVLRPRRYDPRVAADLLRASARESTSRAVAARARVA